MKETILKICYTIGLSAMAGLGVLLTAESVKKIRDEVFEEI